MFLIIHSSYDSSYAILQFIFIDLSVKSLTLYESLLSHDIYLNNLEYIDQFPSIREDGRTKSSNRKTNRRKDGCWILVKDEFLKKEIENNVGLSVKRLHRREVEKKGWRFAPSPYTCTRCVDISESRRTVYLILSEACWGTPIKYEVRSINKIHYLGKYIDDTTESTHDNVITCDPVLLLQNYCKPTVSPETFINHSFFFYMIK